MADQGRNRPLALSVAIAAGVFSLLGFVVGGTSSLISSSSSLGLAPLTISKQDDDEDGEDPIHFVYSSDAGTVIGTKASIRSVRAHASGRVVFHFIGDEPLEGMPYVRFYPVLKLKHKYGLGDFINTHSRHKTERENVNLNRNLPNYVRVSCTHVYYSM